MPTLANGTRFHVTGKEYSLRIQEDMRGKAVVLGLQGSATSSVPGNFRERQLPVGNISLICLGEVPAVLTGPPALGSSRAADPPFGGRVVQSSNPRFGEFQEAAVVEGTGRIPGPQGRGERGF